MTIPAQSYFLQSDIHLAVAFPQIARMQARVRGRIARGQYLGRLSVFKSNESV
jgi:hypothetical protein